MLRFVFARSKKTFSQSDPHFPTDREISNRELQERELERWKPSEDDDADSEKLTLKGSTGSWNQWEANHRMFGVVSTYNPEDYTTKLDETNAEYADRLLRAFGMRSRKGTDHTHGIPTSALAPSSADDTATTPTKRSSKNRGKSKPTKQAAPTGSDAARAAIVDMQSILNAFDDE